MFQLRRHHNNRHLDRSRAHAEIVGAIASIGALIHWARIVKYKRPIRIHSNWIKTLATKKMTIQKLNCLKCASETYAKCWNLARAMRCAVSASPPPHTGAWRSGRQWQWPNDRLARLSTVFDHYQRARFQLWLRRRYYQPGTWLCRIGCPRLICSSIYVKHRFVRKCWK